MRMHRLQQYANRRQAPMSKAVYGGVVVDGEVEDVSQVKLAGYSGLSAEDDPCQLLC